MAPNGNRVERNGKNIVDPGLRSRSSSEEGSVVAPAPAPSLVEPWMMDVVHLHWAKPANFQARVDLSREAKSLLASVVIIEELIDTYFSRCNHLVGGIIFEPRFRRLSAISYKSDLTTEAILTSPLYIDPSCWVMLFMVLSIGLCFYPYHSDQPTPAFHAVNAFRAQEGEAWTERLHDFSRRCLALGEILELTSVPALQSALLVCFRARETDGYTKQLYRLIISSTQSMGFHKLGDWTYTSDMRVEDACRKETITRVWSHLCTRDWASISRDGINVIHPEQMDTRQPYNMSNAHILLPQERWSRPSSEFTEMSYPIASLSLSRLIREVTESRARGTASSSMAASRYYAWVDALPAPLALGSTLNKPASLPIMRWMLYTQCFHQLLKLLRGDLSSQSTRRSLLPIATKLLELFPCVTAACPVVRALWTNWFHTVSASFVVGLELIEGEGGREQDRAASRSLLSAAGEVLMPLSEKGGLFIQALLDFEETRHASPSSAQPALDVNELHLILLRHAAARFSGPAWLFGDLSLPLKGHDSILPGLATPPADGNRRCEIVRGEDWARIAQEMAVDRGESLRIANTDQQHGADAAGSDLFAQVMLRAKHDEMTAQAAKGYYAAPLPLPLSVPLPLSAGHHQQHHQQDTTTSWQGAGFSPAQPAHNTFLSKSPSETNSSEHHPTAFTPTYVNSAPLPAVGGSASSSSSSGRSPSGYGGYKFVKREMPPLPSAMPSSSSTTMTNGYQGGAGGGGAYGYSSALPAPRSYYSHSHSHSHGQHPPPPPPPAPSHYGPPSSGGPHMTPFSPSDEQPHQHQHQQQHQQQQQHHQHHQHQHHQHFGSFQAGHPPSR